MRIVFDPLATGSARVAPSRAGAAVLVIRAGEALPPERPRYTTTDEARERDRHVRGHEQAHLSALGPYAASAVLFDTVKGAQGETIAVGGRIAVDLAEVPGDPAATLRKARTVLQAAGAPGDPSAADLRVAARAYRLMQKAQAELRVDRYA